MLYLVFHLTSAALLANRASQGDAAPRRLPPGYSLETWKPGRGRIVPPTLGLKFALWWLLHVLGIFRNPNYTVLIVRRNGQAVHRTCLIPKYFRWPFMSDNDLQVSSTWTHSSHRCLGIATCALQQAVEDWSKEGRTLWYVTHADNAASIAVCRHMGFRMKTAASRTSRLGIRLLGELALLDGQAGKTASLGALSGQTLPAPGYKAPSISADSGAK